MRRIARRQFIVAASTVAIAAILRPLVVRAQQAALPVIGLLGGDRSDLSGDRLLAFRRGLGQSGFIEGRNVVIEYRWAEGDYDRLPALAADLVRRRVAVIASLAGIPGARAAKAATSTIPIVFFTGADPVAFGIVPSLSRPGGNLTGASSLSDEIGPKRLELVHELLPAATVVAFLVNPTNPNSESQSRDMEAAARKLGLTLQVLHATSERDDDSVFEKAATLKAGALVLGLDLTFSNPRRLAALAALAARHAVPTVGFGPAFAAAGGLMSYGNASNAGDAIQTVGAYAGRILKGEKPADLPVQQATKIGLVLNLKAAKALGIAFPTALLIRADEVIE
jgi:putative tryptophan/tyrosine transport system substrate-binding protein